MAKQKNEILEKIESLVTPVITENKMELVDLEFQHEHGQWVLRLYIDKTGGITLDDCATMSHRIGDVLDLTDPIPQNYSLEVSSPGIYRSLRKPADFKKYQGQRADISLFAPINGRRHYKGTIESVSSEAVSVLVDGQTYALAFAAIAKATLDPDVEI